MRSGFDGQISTSDSPKNLAFGYVSLRKLGNCYFLAEYHPSNWPTSMTLSPFHKERIVARGYALYHPQLVACYACRELPPNRALPLFFCFAPENLCGMLIAASLFSINVLPMRAVLPWVDCL